MQIPHTGSTAALRIGFVPGVTLTKWRKIWAERFPRLHLDAIEVAQPDQREVLAAGQVELCFVRLPVDVAGLHLIKLYEEAPVAWVSKDHVFAAVDEVETADLACETVLELVNQDNLNLVAAGHAVFQVPQSVARTQSRRDLVYRPITDAPATTIGLAWLVANEHELIEEFIGIVRGRTANSSRSAQARATNPPAKKARPAAKPKSTSVARGQRRRHR
jgi:DNA-binding transcriptional LysR family regulator